MVSASKLYERLLESRTSMRFDDFRRVVVAFGFELKRVRGSHHIYAHAQLAERLVLQPSGKDAKPYQVNQFLLIVTQYGLTVDD